jgi:hypothetical protein
VSKRSRRRKKLRHLELVQEMQRKEDRLPVTTYVAPKPGMTTTGYRAAARCHVGAPKVMQIGQVSVHASGWRDHPIWEWDMMLRLGDEFAGFMDRPGGVNLNRAAKKAFKTIESPIKQPEIIQVGWADFYIPSLSKAWWMNLNNHLLKHPKGTLYVHCYGGHGRTGTALAILAALNDFHHMDKARDPVAWVRKHYCKEAVESGTQIEYIEEITGATVHARPGFNWGGYAHGQAYAWWEDQPTGKMNGHANSNAQSNNEKIIHHILKNQKGELPASTVNPTKQGAFWRYEIPGPIQAEWEEDDPVGFYVLGADDHVYIRREDYSYDYHDAFDGSYVGNSHRKQGHYEIEMEDE